jgi:glycerate 2-kinase
MAIFTAALAAVEPGRLVAERLSRRGDRVSIDLGDRSLRRTVSQLRVIGAGKAAAAMARAVAWIVPEAAGVVVAPRARRAAAQPARIGRIAVLPGDHPVPGRASFESTAALLRALEHFPPDATVLCLLSGGASALLAAPADGLTRADKVALNRHLLRCGASIQVMNAVRKHLSAVKGGWLAVRAAGREVITLALSDVPGDDLATIGSGPTVADPTTFGDALRGLGGRGGASVLPGRILQRLTTGADGDLDETPGPGDPRLRRCRAVVIGCNDTALAAAAESAEKLGYRVRRARRTLHGEAAECARLLVGHLPVRPTRPTCVLAGGETVVTAAGSSGCGGRCQEMALAAAAGLAGGGWTVLFAGTDGRDGPTTAAGAFADGTSADRAGRGRLASALACHDSYPLLRQLGDVLPAGPTGTNVMDVAIALHPGTVAPQRLSRST